MATNDLTIAARVERVNERYIMLWLNGHPYGTIDLTEHRGDNSVLSAANLQSLLTLLDAENTPVVEEVAPAVESTEGAQ